MDVRKYRFYRSSKDGNVFYLVPTKAQMTNSSDRTRFGQWLSEAPKWPQQECIHLQYVGRSTRGWQTCDLFYLIWKKCMFTSEMQQLHSLLTPLNWTMMRLADCTRKFVHGHTDRVIYLHSIFTDRLLVYPSFSLLLGWTHVFKILSYLNSDTKKTEYSLSLLTCC